MELKIIIRHGCDMGKARSVPKVHTPYGKVRIICHGKIIRQRPSRQSEYRSRYPSFLGENTGFPRMDISVSHEITSHQLM